MKFATPHVLPLLWLLHASPLVWGQVAENVIVLVGDGQGFNHVVATHRYTGLLPAHLGSEFISYGMQTHSAGSSGSPAWAVYDSTAMFAGFPPFATINPTDSAAAATAMFSGVKTYDGRINMDIGGTPLKSFFEYASESGKAVGVVSSVQLSHATPAATYGHNLSRGNFTELGLEAINSSFNVIIGGGNADFGNDGEPAISSDVYVGGTDAWNALKSETPPNGWTLIQDKADFEAIAAGTLKPEKVFGVFTAAQTLQQRRSNPIGFFDPKIETTPDLSTLAQAALQILGTSPGGFALMIEGGAIDWAAHSNQIDRMIEESIDFNATVDVIVEYLNNNTHGNNWANTLVIVTGDHETGHLWGTEPESDIRDTLPPDTASSKLWPITASGNNVLTETVWYSSGHTNALIPLWIRGAGADLMAHYIIGEEDIATRYRLVGFEDNHPYVDNTSIFRVMAQSAGIGVNFYFPLLGYVYAANGGVVTPGWLYSYSLSRWVWLATPAQEQGSWFYFPKHQPSPS